jgi:hypothetical protein
MTPITHYRDWQGVSKPTAKDLHTLVAVAGEGSIVWSASETGDQHQVRYGLQVAQFGDWWEALTEFGNAVGHAKAFAAPTEGGY